MNLFKISLFGLFLSLSLAFSSFAFAVEEVQTTVDGVGSANLVATVDIVDASIINQVGNKFQIYFALENEQGLQTGVKYGVQLIPENGSYIAHEQVYEESLTLYENSEQSREIEYTAPSYLGGTYILQLVSMNESSFPFGIANLGKVKLTATTKTVEIDTKSCYLQVVGDKSQTKYQLMQSIDIQESEMLTLTCTATNNTAGDETMYPVFETRYMSAFGGLAPSQGGDDKAITFKKGEKKAFTIDLPKGDISQFYNLSLFLKGSVSSNFLTIRYIVSGISGSIDKISLDKDYYDRGVQGTMTLGWQARAGQYARSTSGAASLPTVTFEATIKNDKGSECANPIKQELKWDVNESNTKIPFEISSKCMNPTVSATMKDKDGNILDQKEFEFKSNPMNDNGTKLPMKSIVIGVVAIILVIALSMYMKRKNNNGQIA